MVKKRGTRQMKNSTRLLYFLKTSFLYIKIEWYLYIIDTLLKKRWDVSNKVDRYIAKRDIYVRRVLDISKKLDEARNTFKRDT